MDGHFARAVLAGDVGQSHFVAPGSGELRHKRNRALALRHIRIRAVALADVARQPLRVLPRPHRLRILVVHHDSRQRGRRHILRRHGLLPRCQLRLQRRHRLLVRAQRRLLLRRYGQRHIHPASDIIRVIKQRPCARENPRHRVIIPLRDRVELVVMAPRTAHRLPEHGLPNRIELLVNHVEPQLLLVLLLVVRRPQRQKSRRRQQTPTLLRRRGLQQIARDLLPQKPVKRHAAIERPDHIIPIPPRILIQQRPPSARRLREPRHVQPVPPPMLAKLRRRQHRLQRLARRREPRHIQRKSPRQNLRRRIRRRPQPRSLQLRQNKIVHRIARPRRILHRRQRSLARRHIRPKLPPIFQAHPRLLLRHRRALARVRRAHRHPLLQHRDFRIGQLPFLRHLELRIRVAHGLDEQTFLHLPRHNRRAAIAARLPARPRVQRQPALRLLPRRVTLQAPLRQQRPHTFLKKIHALRCSRESRER